MNKDYRIVETDEIIALKNTENNPKGVISLTAITPTQIVHVKPLHADIDTHELLGGVLYSDLFPKIEVDPTHFIIELRHSDDRYNGHMCCVYMPSYITNKEFEYLNELLELLKQNGIKIYSMITDFDPRSKKDVPVVKRGAEFEDLDVIDYLITQNKVTDYDLPFEEKRLPKPDKSKQI